MQTLCNTSFLYNYSQTCIDIPLLYELYILYIPWRTQCEHLINLFTRLKLEMFYTPVRATVCKVTPTHCIQQVVTYNMFCNRTFNLAIQVIIEFYGQLFNSELECGNLSLIRISYFVFLFVQTCFICKADKKKKMKSGATSGCALASCRKTYHYLCVSLNPKTVAKRYRVDAAGKIRVLYRYVTHVCSSGLWLFQV